MRLIFSLAVLVLSVAYSDAKNPGLESFIAELPSPQCKARFNRIDGIETLGTEKTVVELLGGGPERPELEKTLQSWSPDLLFLLAHQIEQRYLAICPSNQPLETLLLSLKRCYLRGLGIKPEGREHGEIDHLFRGLSTTEDNRPLLKKRLRSVQGPRVLKEVYGNIADIRGVLVESSAPIPEGNLDLLLNEICPRDRTCPFWNESALYKVQLTQKNGLAAYTPETASLVLSRSLVTQSSPLEKLIVIHELAHVAIQYMLNIEQRDWVREFAIFSGWDYSKKLRIRKIKLITARRGLGPMNPEWSEHPAFTLVSESPYLGIMINGKLFEGFVFRRSYHRSLESEDVSEDLADHIAAFYAMPERFCLRNAPVAPRKYRWIAKEVRGEETTLECLPRLKKP